MRDNEIKLSDKQTQLFEDDVAEVVHPRPSCCNKVSLFNRIKFVAKNASAIIVVLSLTVTLRAILGSKKIQEPAIIHAKNGTALAVTDIGSCVALLLAHFLVKYKKPRSSRNDGTVCCRPKLMARTAARFFIPFLIGLGSLFFVKLAASDFRGPDRSWPGPNNYRLLEESDAVGWVILTAAFHLLDLLLERCGWHSNPYDYEEMSTLNPNNSSIQPNFS